MKDFQIMPRLKPTCARCGEELTAPYEFQGGLYGWTCIKIVNPLAKKPKDKQIWVECHFELETLNNGEGYNNRKITGFYNGKGYVDFWCEGYTHPRAIIVNKKGVAFIDVLKYKRATTDYYKLNPPIEKQF